MALDALVAPGAPESPLRGPSLSLNKLAMRLAEQGHPVSDDTVRRLLIEAGYSLHGLPLPARNLAVDKIEHRLFSFISKNWRGRPLTCHEVIVNTIVATTTRARLTVTAELDTGS